MIGALNCWTSGATSSRIERCIQVSGTRIVKAACWHGVCHFAPSANLGLTVRYPITAMGTACVSAYRTLFDPAALSRKPRKQRAYAKEKGSLLLGRLTGWCPRQQRDLPRRIEGEGSMPLLPLEPFIFPDDLLTQPAQDKQAFPLWWVLHTRPRAEKALARKLLQGRTAFFLPLHKRQWRKQGRLHCSYTPLFPGYIFVQGDREAIFKTQMTNQVARILAVEDQRQLHADLARVYCLIAAGAPLAPEERLQPGAPVEITGGPLAGL